MMDSQTQRCVSEHPESYISILTNGKNFSNIAFTQKLSEIKKDKITFCVSFHSSIDTDFDKIVGAKGSYILTQKGIYHLASLGFFVEIRIVIQKINYQNLEDFASHLYGYFPFCCHYAFMGLELHGLAEKNKEKVYVSPSEYKIELKNAVLYLARRGLPVSIYNLPLCCLDQEVRQFARKSISSWKNIYISACDRCTQKEDCCGFFETSSFLPIEEVMPL